MPRFPFMNRVRAEVCLSPLRHAVWVALYFVISACTRSLGPEDMKFCHQLCLENNRTCNQTLAADEAVRVESERVAKLNQQLCLRKQEERQLSSDLHCVEPVKDEREPDLRCGEALQQCLGACEETD